MYSNGHSLLFRLEWMFDDVIWVWMEWVIDRPFNFPSFDRFTFWDHQTFSAPQNWFFPSQPTPPHMISSIISYSKPIVQKPPFSQWILPTANTAIFTPPFNLTALHQKLTGAAPNCYQLVVIVPSPFPTSYFIIVLTAAKSRLVKSNNSQITVWIFLTN
jgi:hypothetical protein